MTLRHFEVFLAVHDGGGTTAAARALNVAQPAVSRTVKELERYYGVLLFERLSGRLVPTDGARTLVPYARHLLGLYGEMEEALRLMERAQRLRLGASVTVGTTLVGELLARFERLLPTCEISVVVDNTAVVERMLLADELDLGLVEGRVHARELLAEPFMEDELVLVLPRSHPLGEKASVGVADLEGLPFIVREEGSGTRELFASAMEDAGAAWKAAWVCSNAEAIKAAVMGGHGFAVLSRRSVGAELAGGSLAARQVQGLDLRRDFSIVLHRNKFITPAIDGLRAVCRAYESRRQDRDAQAEDP